MNKPYCFRNRITIGGLLVIGLSLSMAACAPEQREEEEIVRPVKFHVVQQGSPEVTRTFAGTTQPAIETAMSFKVSGLVSEIPVNVGDQVAAGQLLAKLDPADYQINLEKSRAGLEQAEAQARSARANYDRIRALYENQSVSMGDLESARTAAESAQAQVAASEQQLAAARLQLAYTELRAPMACAVAAVDAEINEVIAQGHPVLTLNCGECPEVLIAVPDRVVANLAEGMAAAIELPGFDDSVRGVLTTIGIDTRRGGTTYPVTLRILEHCAGIRSGLPANVTLKLDRKQSPDDGFSVPLLAVGQDNGGHYVYVLTADADGWRVHRRGVTLGDQQSGEILIVDGLQAGEKIVTAGVRFLSDSERVNLQE